MKRHLTATLAFLSLGALASASAQGLGSITIGPSGITFTPAKPAPVALSVDGSLDRDRSGNGTPVYTVGDKASVNVKTNRDAYIYLFNVGADGRVSQLPTARNNGTAFLRGGNTATFPAANAGYDYSVTGPAGLNRLYVVASPTRLRGVDEIRLQQQLSGVNNWTGNLSVGGLAGAAIDAINWDVRSPVQGGNLLVTSNAAGGRVLLGGRDIGPVNSAISGLRPGNYTFTVTAPGHSDATFSVEVAGGRTTNLRVNLSPDRLQQTGTLRVLSNVPAARVFIDGREMGAVNQSFTGLRVGDYTVRVEAPGYRTVETQMTVLAGQNNVARFDLSREAFRRDATLLIESNVAAARVIVDGRDVGSVGRAISGLRAGISTVRVEAPGYDAAELKLQLVPNQTSSARIDLSRQQATASEGTLRVDANVAGARVLLNGRDMGSVGSDLRGIAAGLYNVRVEAPGYKPASLKLEVLPNQTNAVRLDLSPARASRTVTLTLRGAMDGSEVRIDGRSVGYVRNGVFSVDVERGSRNVTIISPRGPRDDFSVEMNGSRTVEVSQMGSEFIYDLLR